MANSTITAAISTSIREDRTITLESVTLDEVLAAAIDYETDYVEADGRIDIWGWTDATPADTQDWRLDIPAGGINAHH